MKSPDKISVSSMQKETDTVLEKQKSPVASISVEPSTGSEAVSEQEDTLKFGPFHINKNNGIHRTLLPRHISLIAMGGSIGTALFITIGGGLTRAGPLGLLLGFIFWTFVILLLTTAMGEMTSYLPIPSPYVTMAGRCVDECMEFVAGWNFYLMEVLYVPFEIVAVNGMIHYWREDYSAAIPLCISIAIYVVFNVFAVRIYGESEFWLSIGKIILIVMLFFFTIVTMCGGNPKGDAYGFRNWHAEGGPLPSYLASGDGGRLNALLAGTIQGCFTIVGPEYICMVAAEAVNPRKTMPVAFRTIIWRLVFFYLGGAFCVTALIAYNDPVYLELSADTSNAASSPYVVAMNNLGIEVLPHIVNALIVSSAFSAGNSYVYISSRVLYGLSLRGHAPKIFSLCTKSGVPIFCIGVAVCFSMLSLLQLGSGSYQVLGYLISICSVSQILNYVYMTITYIGFFRACKAQGIDRNGFAYKSWFQPYAAYFTLVFFILLSAILGYTVFLPGQWDDVTFIFNYIMIFINVALVFFWKFFKRTKTVDPKNADLVTGLKEIEEHEYEYYASLNTAAEGLEESKFKKALHWVF